MRWIIGTSVLLCLLLLAGCQASRLAQLFGSPADEKAASHYVDLLRDRQYAAIEAVVDPSQRRPDLHQKLETMASYLPSASPTSVKVVGVQSMQRSGERTISYTFQYQYPDRWLLIRVVRRTTDGSTTLLGLRVQPLPAALETINRFTLHGKSALQYAVLAAAIVVPLLCIYALALCVRTPLRGRRWPWILFIIFGLVTVSVNWTSGQWNVQAISFLLFGAGASKAPYGPWIISVGFPLGAIWFLARRRHLIRQATQAPVPPELPARAGPGAAE